MSEKRDPKTLRSHRWFGGDGGSAAHKHRRIRQAGFDRADYDGKPVVAVLSTWSEFNTCHAHFPQRIEEIKRGVWQAGGFPVVTPVQAVSESFVRPTSMMYRNLLAMEVEETIRSQPVDGAVLLGGCDKTTPGLVMGAASAGVPAIFVPAGAMMSGHWRGETVGTGSSTWAADADLRAGKISQDEWERLNQASVRSPGTCNTMGTASTMTILTEVIGLSLPGASSIPALDAAHARMASQAGRRIVEMIAENLTPAELVTDAALRNAVVVDMAISGSTNSLIHLIAMANRMGRMLTLDDFAAVGDSVPVLCNIMPAGKHLMEDFHFAGGVPALMARLADRLALDARNCQGGTVADVIADADVWDNDVIRSPDDPVYPAGALVVLKGSLAPRGAVLKRSAATPALCDHTGPAVVFRGRQDMLARIDDPDLDVTENSVLVLTDAGPVGGPGMPEWGMLPIPRKLLAQGVRDMVRISDARMSGTSYGTCVLHVCPEGAAGGPLGLVRDGDLIRLDAEGGRLDLLVEDDELERRRTASTRPEPHYARGYGALFVRHVLQADQGCDFDFLLAGEPTPDPEIH